MTDDNDVKECHNKACVESDEQKSATPTITFELLAQGHPVVLVNCEGQTYQLRKTKNGKLTLHK